MIVAVLSDIHGNHSALKAVLEDFPDSVEQVIFLGDLCGYYPFVSECCDLLHPYSVVSVLGNHDRELLRSWDRNQPPGEEYTKRYGPALARTWMESNLALKNMLSSSPEKRLHELDGLRLLLLHGSPTDPVEGRVYPDHREWDSMLLPSNVDFVLMGHTHYAFYRRLGNYTIINPGSVGQARDGHGAAYAVIDTVSGSCCFRRIAYDPTVIINDAQSHAPGFKYLWEVLLR